MTDLEDTHDSHAARGSLYFEDFQLDLGAFELVRGGRSLRWNH